MLSGEKILITGAAGGVASPITRQLAKHNEVWGVARFTDPKDRQKLEAMGVRCVRKDLGRDTLDDLPDDFTYVFHAAAVGNADLGPDWPYSYEVNAQGTARLMYHCRKAKGFLSCSTTIVYDPFAPQPVTEKTPVGQHIHHYSLSKIAGEQLVTFISNEFKVPATILRIASFYGRAAGGVSRRVQSLVEGKEITLHSDRPNYFNPIFEDDAVELGVKAMALARTPPLVVNFGGDVVVSAEEYLAFAGDLTGKKPKLVYTDKTFRGMKIDVTYMHQVLGHCKVHWKDGVREVLKANYPRMPLRVVE